MSMFEYTEQKKIWSISPLTVRILAINITALLVLLLGLLYTGKYEQELIHSELQGMIAEGKLLAGAIAEGGVRGDFERAVLAEDLSRHMVRKIASVSKARIILFSKTGEFMADSHQMLGVGGIVQVEELPPPWQTLAFKEQLSYFLGKILKKLPTRIILPVYPNVLSGRIQSYPNALDTLNGEINSKAWRSNKGGLFMTAALPVQNLKHVLGAVLLMRSGGDIEAAVYNVQITVLKAFLIALLISVLLSLYLSETIGRPIMRLAKSAEIVQSGIGQYTIIPDFSYRNDEIGILSSAFRDMTKALSERIKAIENFATDVAHELKNPLASMRSAVETIPMVKTQEKKDKLMAIIQDDIGRMDLLITDILSASRLDAEMEALSSEKLDINKILNQLTKLHNEHRQNAKHNNKIVLKVDKKNKSYMANAHEVRLAQVFQNIISNAISFSGEGKQITINLFIKDKYVGVSVENSGPAIPEDKLETIFHRFYTERPKQEGFGLHSGLGLSISRQIIEAHNGKIYAENLQDKKDKHAGVRFTILLPQIIS